MQFSTLALMAGLMASFTYAQTIQQELAKIPVCAMTCLATASTVAGCGATDFSCQCGSGREAITKSALPCVTLACQATDLVAITQASTEICRLNALAAITGSSTSASATGTGTAAIIATSMVSSLSSVRTTATRTATAATTGATGNAASVARFGGVGLVAAGVVAAFAL